MRIRRSNLVMIAVLGGLILLAACGQKGDLYLPEEPAAETRDAVRR